MDVTLTRATRSHPRDHVGALACCVLVSAALLVGLLQTRSALADGDPASDVLLAQNAYYPYQPTVSSGLEATLDELLRSAEHSRLPLKVAVIGSVGDLGADPSFFGHPQAYAQFLDREISFNNKPPLLVIMPSGFGVAAAGSPKALAAIKIDTRHGSDGLVRSAIAAAAALLRAAGRTVASPSVASAGSGRGGPAPTAFFVAPVGLLLVIGIGALIRSRRDRDGLSGDLEGEAIESPTRLAEPD